MPEIIEGQITGENARVAVVVSRYNETITEKLEAGAVETLVANQVADKDITVVRVPGAWELPVVAARLARSGKYQAVICLGSVIKGQTTHDIYINQQVSLSLGQLALECELPILFGLLTCNTLEQAIHRSGGNVGNKGVDTAEAALEMIHLMSKLPKK
ncbi:MAG: 6,7-dimethyl-8-ribityllumazine synthase [Blastopirellula sp.]|nr:MAG: 6,7-dimethyl-8-ribityllumazine synthase [Blastopirellula sp.]